MAKRTSYKKKYLKTLGYGEQSYIPCEVCGSIAVDVHHVNYRSLGGTDDIENLMALCRYHHDSAHSGILSADHLQEIHDAFLADRI